MEGERCRLDRGRCQSFLPLPLYFFSPGWGEKERWGRERTELRAGSAEAEWRAAKARVAGAPSQLSCLEDAGTDKGGGDGVGGDEAPGQGEEGGGGETHFGWMFKL